MINSRPSYARGFTLIELLVVISIIGLLSSVVLASVKTARDKGQVAAGQKFDGYTYRAFGADSVAIFDFDDTSFSPSPSDRSGVGTTLVCGNNTPTTGIKGRALDMLASSLGCSTTSFNPSAFNTAKGSLSFWFKPTAYGISGGSSLINAKTSTWYVIDNTGRIGVPTASINWSNKTLPLNTWTHVLISWTNTSTQIYINGALDKAIQAPLVFSGTALYIGSWSAGETWRGVLDQFAIYTQSIQTAAEAYEIYASELPAYTIAENR